MLLPQFVGPGPVTLVMREVLTMLINVAYKSSRVLRELQLDGAPNPDMQLQVLGAKYVTIRRYYYLPVKQCIHFKIATLAYRTLQSGSPSYLSSLINFNTYLYNGCLAWCNVVLTSRVHSSVKYT